MTSTLTAIDAILQTALFDISGHPFIQIENGKTRNVPLDETYWLATNKAAGAVQQTSDRVQRHAGLFIVDVYAPKDEGLAGINEDLDTIYDAFNSTSILTDGTVKVYITDVGAVPRQQEPNRCRGTIQIKYMCYSQ